MFALPHTSDPYLRSGTAIIPMRHIRNVKRSVEQHWFPKRRDDGTRSERESRGGVEVVHGRSRELPSQPINAAVLASSARRDSGPAQNSQSAPLQYRGRIPTIEITADDSETAGPAPNSRSGSIASQRSTASKLTVRTQASARSIKSVLSVDTRSKLKNASYRLREAVTSSSYVQGLRGQR